MRYRRSTCSIHFSRTNAEIALFTRSRDAPTMPASSSCVTGRTNSSEPPASSSNRFAVRPGTWTLRAVFDLFPRLEERKENRGNQLSGGEQQMLAIGRALVGNPSVLLMDEPSEGLAPVIVEELARAVKRLAQADGLSLILVEQNARLALDISPRAVVMDRGHVVYDGASESLRRDPVKLEQLIGVAKR